MFKIALYISKTYIFIWLTLIFGFLTLIGLLDSLANAADIAKSGGGFSEHELVALLGFGISATKQAFLMTPAVVGASIISILFIDIAMPPAVRSLQTWNIGEYKVKNITAQNPLWIEDSGHIIRATQRLGYNALGDLKFFFRNEKGTVIKIWHVERADYKAPHWELSGLKELEIKGEANLERELTAVSGTKIWETRQTPNSIARLAAEPRDLALSEMRTFSKRGNSGSKPSFAYKFWHAHRITRPLAIFILLILCTALMQRTRREDTGNKAQIIGITIAFMFLIIDGAMATFAVSGGLTVLPAIALPLIFFGLIGSFMLLRTESL